MKAVILIILVISLAILLINQRDWVIHFKDGEWDLLREMMGHEWKRVLFFTMIFMLMQNVISLIPFVLLTMFNIWLFGFWYGYLWSLVGNFIGSVLVFYTARYGFQSWAQKYDHLAFKQKLEANGFMVILASRLMPFMPASVVNIVGGISNIRSLAYIFGTLIGNIIFVFILSLFSVGVLSFEQRNIVFLMLAVLVVFIVGLKIKRDRKHT